MEEPETEISNERQLRAASALNLLSQTGKATASTIKASGDLNGERLCGSVADLATAIGERLLATNPAIVSDRVFDEFEAGIAACQQELMRIRMTPPEQRGEVVHITRQALLERVPRELFLALPNTDAWAATVQTYEEKSRWLKSQLASLEVNTGALTTQLMETRRGADVAQDAMYDAWMKAEIERGTQFAGRLAVFQKQVDDNVTAFSERGEGALLSVSNRFTASVDECVAKLERDRTDRAATLDASLQEHKAAAVAAVAAVDELRAASLTTLKSIQSNHDLSKQLISDTAANAITAEYRAAEESERTAARWWQGATCVVFAGFIVAAIWTVKQAGPSPTAIYFALRAVVASAFAGFLAYGGSQVKSHREEARRLRLIALGIRALDPYIADFPQEDRTATKRGLAERIFVPGDAGGRIDAVGAMDLASKSLDVVKSVAETTKNVTDAKNTRPGPPTAP
jgi:hypothetical protein